MGCPMKISYTQYQKLYSELNCPGRRDPSGQGIPAVRLTYDNLVQT